MSAFRLDDVHFAYGRGATVLAGVSFAADPGETVALLGRNGAGKTTLTRLLVALLHPNRGTVSVGGDTTAGKSPEDLAHRIAYVFQHPDQQLFQRTVLEEVAFGPRQLGASRLDAERSAADALHGVGMEQFSSVHPYDLPLPLRKLVTIAAAVAQGSEVLVLDEPTQGLDRNAMARVSDLVRDLATRGVAILAVTHDLVFVAEAMNRAIVLADGRIGADKPARDIIMDPTVGGIVLRQPEAARLSQALRLSGAPIRVRDVADAVGRLLRTADVKGSLPSSM